MKIEKTRSICPISLSSYLISHFQNRINSSMLGKVIYLGIYSHRLFNNDAFLKFFDNLVFPQAVGQPYFSNNITLPTYYYLSTGNLSKIELKEPEHLTVDLIRNKNVNDRLILTLPRQLISVY
jgi:hypothetical protein